MNRYLYDPTAEGKLGLFESIAPAITFATNAGEPIDLLFNGKRISVSADTTRAQVYIAYGISLDFIVKRELPEYHYLKTTPLQETSPGALEACIEYFLAQADAHGKPGNVDVGSIGVAVRTALLLQRDYAEYGLANWKKMTHLAGLDHMLEWSNVANILERSWVHGPEYKRLVAAHFNWNRESRPTAAAA